VRLDVAAPLTGCTKVDLLFVVDNSGSMANEQDNLAASVPGFVAAIEARLALEEQWHVGVITTDPYVHNSPPCSAVLGALVDRVRGPTPQQPQSCGPFAEGRYLSGADDLGAGVECVMRVGVYGSPEERVGDAIVAALAPELRAPGACNAGFFRDDALLVLVIITDEDDFHSAGEPQDWANAVLDLKLGHSTNATVLGLLPRPSPNQCDGPTSEALRLRSFVESFTFAHLGDVCAPSYAGDFAAALDTIDAACDAFVRPG
jgi:hypothetical protein